MFRSKSHRREIRQYRLDLGIYYCRRTTDCRLALVVPEECPGDGTTWGGKNDLANSGTFYDWAVQRVKWTCRLIEDRGESAGPL